MHSSQVCKRGAASGITFGDVSADRFVLLNQRPNGGRPSLNWVVNVTARDPPFSFPGDSGGWVYDTAGCLVGSVVGQATGSCTELTANGLEVIPGSRDSWSFITPIEATFRDIEKVTGCQVTLDLE